MKTNFTGSNQDKTENYVRFINQKHNLYHFNDIFSIYNLQQTKNNASCYIHSHLSINFPFRPTKSSIII